jgi:ABC-type transport system involved in multi-copper enzyme maturation permease subunit
MMVPLLRAELRRIVGRRGSFYGTIAFSMLFVVLTVAFADPKNGKDAVDAVSVLGRYSGVLGVVVLGALAGSYDTASGTMRYLVLTGVPRWKLAVVRLLGVMVAVVPLTILISVVAVAYGASQDGMTGKDAAGAVWATLATLWIWGLVAASVGMVMKSNGPAIAVGVVLFFGGILITGLVASQVSESLANYLLPTVAEQVSSLDSKGADSINGRPLQLALGGGLAVLVIWLAALTALAVARTNRDEY